MRKSQVLLLRSCALVFVCACAAPRLAIRPAPPNPGFRTLPPGTALQSWQYAHAGDFLRAEQQPPMRRGSWSDALTRGLLSISCAESDSAEAEFRAVLDSRADSAIRGLAYLGLECLFLSQERYPALETLEMRAHKERLEYDSTNRFVAQALNRLGAMNVEAASTRLRVPMKLSSTGTPVVRASANGRVESDFWLDTGASMNVVSESFARRHGVRVISERQGAAGTATRRKVVFRMGAIDSLGFGNLTLRRVPVIVLRDRDLSFKLLFVTLLKIDAIIGWPVISRFRSRLDYAQRGLTLEYPATESDTGAHNLFFAGQPCVRVAVDSSGPLNFILDTGASLSTITKSGLAKLLAAPRLSRSLGCVGGAGGSDAGGIKAIKAARLTVAGQELYPVSLAVHDVPDEGLAVSPDGLLGEDVLRNFTVVIDAGRGRLTLIR